jgi:hypothetical protein
MSSINLTFESIANIKLVDIELDKIFFILNGKISPTIKCQIPDIKNSNKKQDKNIMYKIDKYFII